MFSLSVTVNFAPEGQTEICEKRRHESLVLVFITYAQNSPLHVNAVHPDVSNKTRITFNLIPLAYLAYMRSKYSGKPVHFAQARLSFRCTSMRYKVPSTFVPAPIIYNI